ncbi:MAG: ribonuclease R, partial [Alphaproteobacteria bacterium]|nr:ribonuclease R [Alphaproteobacteria bacterium]
MPRASRDGGKLTRDKVLAAITASPVPLGKRELSRALGIGAEERGALRGLIAELERDGLIERGRGRRFAPPGGLPEVAILEITRIDRD